MRFLSALRQRQDRYGFFGDYRSFAEAEGLCGLGYANPSTIAYARRNARVYGTHRSHLDLQVLAAMLTVRPSRVLDFGGGLGGRYFRLNHFVRAETWNVVDLPTTAAAGNAEFADGILNFTTTIEPADLVLASASLQYVKDPYLTLRELADSAPYLLIDRVPLIERDRLTIQRVDPELFDGSVPAWFFSEKRFLEETSRFTTVLSWNVQSHSVMLDGKEINPFQGFLFRTN